MHGVGGASLRVGNGFEGGRCSALALPGGWRGGGLRPLVCAMLALAPFNTRSISIILRQERKC